MQALKWSISTFKPVLLRSSLDYSNLQNVMHVQLLWGTGPKTSFNPKPSELAQVGPVHLSAESTDVTNLS